VDLQLHRPGDHLYVHSVSETSIRVAEQHYESAIIMSSEQLIDDWPVTSFAMLAVGDLDPVFELQPEIVIIGTGKRQAFLSPELMIAFYRRGIGVEAMNTAAAARTFNVLVSEERNVAAILMPPSS
jgi:uncharacterized protein